MGKKKQELQLVGGKVPRLVKPRRGRFGEVRQDRFFQALAETCNVTAACRIARVPSSTVYRHQRQSAAFRTRWADAIREAYGRLELAMLGRMMKGTVKTRRRDGKIVERMHEYPDAVALQLLRLHRSHAPEAVAREQEVDVEEVRERIAERIERLRLRMEQEAEAGKTEPGE